MDKKMSETEKQQHIQEFCSKFAKFFYCMHLGEKNKFDESFAAAKSAMPVELHDFLRSQFASPNKQELLINTARKYVDGPLYTLKESNTVRNQTQVVSNAIFGYDDPAYMPRIFVTESGSGSAKAQVAELALLYLEKFFKSGRNESPIVVGLSCGSTVLRFVNSMLAKLDRDQAFREMLKNSSYEIVELTSETLQIDYLRSTNNCWNFYQSLKEHNFPITRDDYTTFSQINKKKLSVIYCGLGAPSTSSALFDFLKKTDPALPKFLFEINEVPYYKDSDGVWHTLSVDHPHLARVFNITDQPIARKVVLVCGQDKMHAAADLIRCNNFLFKTEKKLLCTHLFMDFDLYHKMANHKFKAPEEVPK